MVVLGGLGWVVDMSTTCVICLDPGADDMAPALGCKCTRLTVHTACLGEWLGDPSQLGTCPVCRCVARYGISSRIEGPDGVLVAPLPPATPVTFIRFSVVTQKVLYTATVDSSHPSIDMWHTVFAGKDLALWTEDEVVGFDPDRVVSIRLPSGATVPAWKMILARFIMVSK